MISRKLNLSELTSGRLSAFLFGPRGTGKSRLSKDYLESRRLSGARTLNIDLLSLTNQTRYRNNPALFRADIQHLLSLGAEPVVVLIDEVQKLPELLDEVHWFLEEYPERIQFILTGSSARKLRRGGANLLAGRALSLNLHPLSELELDLHLERALQLGTLPRYYLTAEDVTGLLSSYVETYLKEEIQGERLVRKLEPFHRFLSVAAQMNGKQVKYAEIAKEVGVSDQTVRDYFSILIDTLLVFELPAWNRSVRAQLQQMPRFYFFDCGVLNAILGEHTSEVQAGSRRYGNLFESFVVAEFFRQRSYLNIQRGLFSWRTAGGIEVDLVIDQGIYNPPIGIEIKSKEIVDSTDLRGLAEFAKENERARCFCICRAARASAIDGITVLPWQSGITEILKIAGRPPDA
jgi:predicted AAA+ superfamily ATPase